MAIADILSKKNFEGDFCSHCKSFKILLIWIASHAALATEMYFASADHNAIVFTFLMTFD